MRAIYWKIRHARYLYIKRNVEKVWGARYKLGARYLSKNAVILGNIFPTKVFLLRPCCGSSCSVHPAVVYVHVPKKSTFQYQPFSSNTTKRKQGIDVLGTKLRDTLAYTAWKKKKQNDLVSTVSRRNMSVHVGAARRHWDRLHLNAFVCSAVVGRVCQCKISAKYGCSVTTALPVRDFRIELSPRWGICPAHNYSLEQSFRTAQTDRVQHTRPSLSTWSLHVLFIPRLMFEHYHICKRVIMSDLLPSHLKMNFRLPLLKTFYSCVRQLRQLQK